MLGLGFPVFGAHTGGAVLCVDGLSNLQNGIPRGFQRGANLAPHPLAVGLQHRGEVSAAGTVHAGEEPKSASGIKPPRRIAEIT